jgi:hypothetical protein
MRTSGSYYEISAARGRKIYSIYHLNPRNILAGEVYLAYGGV